MTSEEIEKWERYYEEAYQRDLALRIYKQCDAEDDAMEYLKDGTPPPMPSFEPISQRNERGGHSRWRVLVWIGCALAGGYAWYEAVRLTAMFLAWLGVKITGIAG